jgi:enamine deaminase RidA (YjgF/YER057c/UK114 family)
MQRTLINPPGTERTYERFHFSQGNRVGETIWVSGQTGRAADGMAAQARTAFEGLKRILETAGASLDDVVELTTFHTDLRGEVAEFMGVKDDYFPSNYPAWTAVGVTQLAIDGLKVEVRAVAVVGSWKG